MKAYVYYGMNYQVDDLHWSVDVMEVSYTYIYFTYSITYSVLLIYRYGREIVLSRSRLKVKV